MRLSASESVHFSERRARLRMSSESCPHTDMLSVWACLSADGYRLYRKKAYYACAFGLKRSLYVHLYIGVHDIKILLYRMLLIYILQMLSHTELCALNIMRAERFIHSVMLVDSISELLRIRSRQAVIVL